MNDPLYKQMTEFLLGLGIEEMEHTGKTYIGHLLAVHRLMEEQGCGQTRAGRASSTRSTAPRRSSASSCRWTRRDEVRDLIGERAERLAYLNCAMDRASFDAALERGRPPTRCATASPGRRSCSDDEDFDDLCRVHLYDWLEQVPRSPLRLRLPPGGLPGDGGAAGPGRRRRLRSRLRGRARGEFAD